MRLGMLTSVCGFASLLPSGFPGLAQLGAYSISGLIAAAAVTRFVLPVLLPSRLRDTRSDAPGRTGGGMARACAASARPSTVGTRACARRRRPRRAGARARHAVESGALALEPRLARTAAHRCRAARKIWARPTRSTSSSYRGATLEAVLRGAERAALALAPLIDAQRHRRHRLAIQLFAEPCDAGGAARRLAAPGNLAREPRSSRRRPARSTAVS